MRLTSNKIEDDVAHILRLRLPKREGLARRPPTTTPPSLLSSPIDLHALILPATMLKPVLEARRPAHPRKP